MKSQVILVAVVALVAGVVGGFIGSSAGGADHSAHASDAAKPDAPPAPTALRSVEDELELIEARGGWELRKALMEMRPIRLEVGSETLISAPTVSWKPGKDLDYDMKFYRLVGGKLELVDIKKE